MNLFICATPLQLFIANKIIEQEKLAKCDILFIGDPLNLRNQYYINKIQLVANDILIVPNYFFKKARNNVISLLAKQVIKSLANSYKKIFLANFDNHFYSFILSYIQFEKLFSFDDGVGNINQGSVFYHVKKYSFYRRWRHSIQYKRKFFPEDLKNRIECHFTIFQDLPNIISNTRYINIFNKVTVNSSVNKNTINILVGTVYKETIAEHSMTENIMSRLQEFIEQYRIDLYIPHPRDEENYFVCQTLTPQKITEEVIIDYINDGYEVNLYGIGSTVLINMLYCDNVNVFFIDSPYFISAVSDINQLDATKKATICMI